MKTSDSRILVTHVGSLPRGERLTDLLIEDELGTAIDRAIRAPVPRRGRPWRREAGPNMAAWRKNSDKTQLQPSF